MTSISEPVVMSPEIERAMIAKLEAETRLAEKETELKDYSVRLSERSERKTLAEDPQNMTYAFHTGVTAASVSKAIEQISIMARSNPGSPIRVIFSSPGGGVLEGFGFFDFLRSLSREGHHITTETLGFAASMGGILLQAGDTRVAHKNSWLLIHEIETVQHGKSSMVEDSTKFVERLEKQLLEILAARSSLTPLQIKKRWRKMDWWLDANEMLELGFVDEVV